jgi:hypothetical protein
MFALKIDISTWYVGGEQSTSIEPVISPIILDVWVQHIADPFISIDAIEVLEVISRQKWRSYHD